jgi:ADP-ribosylglycohydrolase
MGQARDHRERARPTLIRTPGTGPALSDPEYAVWCAARHLDNFEEALWATASAGGDVDTICAIAGGIVAARTGTRTWVPQLRSLIADEFAV